MAQELPLELGAAFSNVCAGTVLKHKGCSEHAVVVQCWENVVAVRRSPKNKPKKLLIKPKHFELFIPKYDEWLVVAWGPDEDYQILEE